MKRGGNTAFGRAWTSEEDALVRSHYASDGAKYVADRVGRTITAVRHRAYELDVSRNRRWTLKEDRELQMSWGPLTINEIAKKLRRTPVSVYWRARQLGIELGCPQGYEYLSAAAERTGYATVQLRRICRWAGVGISRAMVRPDVKARSGHTHHIVVPFDVDDAIARWCATEPVESVARRHGYTGSVIRRIALIAIANGDTRIDPPPSNRKDQSNPNGQLQRGHWRVPSAVIDELVAAEARRETLEDAAQRVGVGRRTLHGWLTTAGVAVRKGFRLEPEDVDRVVAARKSTMSLQEAAREFGRSHPFVVDIVRHAIAEGVIAAPERRRGAPWRLPREQLRALIRQHLEGRSGRRVATTKTRLTQHTEIHQVA